MLIAQSMQEALRQAYAILDEQSVTIEKAFQEIALLNNRLTQLSAQINMEPGKPKEEPAYLGYVTFGVQWAHLKEKGLVTYHFKTPKAGSDAKREVNIVMEGAETNIQYAQKMDIFRYVFYPWLLGASHELILPHIKIVMDPSDMDEELLTLTSKVSKDLTEKSLKGTHDI